MPAYELAGASEGGASTESIGNVSFKDEHPVLPESAQPDTEVPLALKVSNNAEVINPIDNDACWSTNGGSGYSTELVVRVNGSIRAIDSRCFASGRTIEWNITIPALSPGEADVEIQVRGKNSERVSDTLNHTISVADRESGGGDDDNENENNDDDDNENGGGIWGEFGPTGKLTLIGAGVAGLWLVSGGSGGARTFNLRRR